MFTFLVVSAVVSVGSFALGIRGVQVRENASAIRRWAALAARRGGEMVSGDARFWDAPTLPSMECMSGRVRVHLDVRGAGIGADLRVRACYFLPAGPSFSLAGRRGVTGLLLGFGGQDVSLGTTELDNRFSLKSKQPAMTRIAWTKRAAEKLHLQATVFSDGRVIDLQLPGWKRSNVELENALDLVGELASADVFGIGALEALPDATLEYRNGPWDRPSPPEACVLMPAPVRLGPVISGGLPVTRARTECAKQDSYRVTIRDGAAQLTAGRIDVPLAELDAPGDGDLVCWGDEIAFMWASIETDPDKLMVGAQLVARLARLPAAGVYR